MAAGVVVVAALLCGLGGERSAFRAPRAPASLASLRGGVDVPQPPIDAFATAAAAAAAAAPEADVSEPESFAFRAEMAQLMSLIINTFYSNKDIFLRELISNAADAIDKARFGSVDSSSAPPLSADGGGASPAADEIRLTADAAAQTLTIEDSGVGMSRDDLIAFLGTVARSGTKAFMQQAVAAAAAAGGGGGAGAAELIGQFGVGFYSAFLVAERVTVYTRKAGGPLLAWESAAEGGYTIRKPTEAEVAARAGERSRLAAGGRGTAVVLALKPEASVYLAESKLAELVRTHSAFVAPPIKLWARRRRLETDTAPADGSAPPSPAEEAAAMLRAAMAADAAEAGEAVESVDASADERLAVWDWRPLNELKPLWLRAPGEISESEYAAFYKSVSGDWQPPLARKHFAVEGAALQLRALLFTPRGGGLDALDGGSARASARGIKLYVRRVFVCDAAAADFLPDWAAFARGVIDSDSLELNVSREHLQRSAAIGAIRKALTKRVLEMVEEMAAEDKRATAAAADATTAVDADGGGRLRYDEFYAQWGKNLKLGVHEDERSRARLLALLRFPSTHSLPSAAAVSERAAADVDGGARSAGSGLRASEMSSLDEYVGRMPAHQTAIYYLSGESLRAVRAAPALELAVARGFEVLFLVEPIDEYAIARVGTFKGKRLVSLATEEATLDATDADAAEADKAALLQARADSAELCAAMAAILDGKVDKVSVSARLASSPCTLVTSAHGWSANMERIMKAQALREPSAAALFGARKSFEINARHPIIAALRARVAEAGGAESAAAEPSVRELTLVLYETALLDSGFSLEEPAQFSRRIHKMMRLGLGLGEEEVERRNDAAAPAADAGLAASDSLSTTSTTTARASSSDGF